MKIYIKDEKITRTKYSIYNPFRFECWKKIRNFVLLRLWKMRKKRKKRKERRNTKSLSYASVSKKKKIVILQLDI